jgi:uncharacterized membrane protein YphA (DoxX/SURF4 family)
MVAKSNAARMLLSIGRILLGGVFLYAVFAKLNYPPGNFLTLDWSNWKLAIEIFAISVNGYKVLPDWAVTPVAYFVPALETVLGLLLLAGLGLRWAALASAGLLGFFFSLMLRAYLLGQSIDCGCFGPGDQLGPRTLLRDGALLLLAVLVTLGAFWQRRQRGAEAQELKDVQEVTGARVTSEGSSPP